MLVETSENAMEVEVTPGVMYMFQAVAREDKGVIGGIDWNKSMAVEFKTSRSAPPGVTYCNGRTDDDTVEEDVGTRSRFLDFAPNLH